MGVPAVDRDALRNAVTGIRHVYTMYPRVRQIEASLIDLIKRDNTTSEGNIHALIGPSRSGKSHLLNLLVHEFPRLEAAVQGPDGNFSDHIPVVRAAARNISTKALAQRIYLALTLRHPDTVFGSRYNEDVVVAGIIHVATECRTKLLILDEVHELIDRKTDRVVGDVAVLIKDLVNAKVFSVLLVGTQKAERLIHFDEEMQARTPVIHRMTPFEQGVPADFRVWLEILGDIDGELSDKVFRRLSGLCEPGLAAALLIGASGIVGHMATLVEQAAYLAVDEMVAGASAPRVRWKHLEKVFDNWAPASGQTNPFSPGSRPHAGVVSSSPERASVAGDAALQVTTGARGRTRRNARDAIFRK